MKSEYLRLAHQLDDPTIALAIKIADEAASEIIASECRWVGPDEDDGVAGEVPRGDSWWYDTTSDGFSALVANVAEAVHEALVYLERRKLLTRNPNARHLVRLPAL